MIAADDRITDTVCDAVIQEISTGFVDKCISTSLNAIVYGNENIFAVKIINISIDLFVPAIALFSDVDVIFAKPFVCIDDIRYADGILPRFRYSYASKVFVLGLIGCISAFAAVKNSILLNLSIVPVGELATLECFLELVVSLRIMNSIPTLHNIPADVFFPRCRNPHISFGCRIFFAVVALASFPERVFRTVRFHKESHRPSSANLIPVSHGIGITIKAVTLFFLVVLIGIV